MIRVKSEHLDKAIEDVLETVHGVRDLYPNQKELVETLFENDNIFYTDSTNSGKTLPTVLFPEIIKKLNIAGYNFPENPKVLFVTALNSLQLSLVNNVSTAGELDCDIVTSDNIDILINSDTSVLFISPETLKLPAVTEALLLKRKSFVLKVVDECHLGKVL